MSVIAIYSIFAVVDEIKHGFDQLNDQVVTFKKASELDERLRYGLNVDFVMDINYHDDVHNVCCEFNVKYAVWSFDSGISLKINRNLREMDYLFLFNSWDFKVCSGFHQNTFFLPFSAADSFIHPPKSSGFAYDVLAIMNSYHDNLREAEEDFQQSLAGVESENVRKTMQLGKSLLELTVEKHLNIFDRNMISAFLNDFIKQCGVNPFPEREKQNSLCYQYGQILSSKQRQAVLTQLALSGMQLEVFGDHNWKDILPESNNVHLNSSAPYDRLPVLYNQAKINVNLTQIQNIDSIPQRIFHLLAAGAFILTNASEEIERSFQVPIHLETFRSLEELTDKTAFYLKNEKARIKIAEAGHREFMEKHRMSYRLTVIKQHLSA